MKESPMTVVVSYIVLVNVELNGRVIGRKYLRLHSHSILEFLDISLHSTPYLLLSFLRLHIKTIKLKYSYSMYLLNVSINKKKKNTYYN